MSNTKCALAQQLLVFFFHTPESSSHRPRDRDIIHSPIRVRPLRHHFLATPLCFVGQSSHINLCVCVCDVRLQWAESCTIIMLLLLHLLSSSEESFLFFSTSSTTYSCRSHRSNTTPAGETEQQLLLLLVNPPCCLFFLFFFQSREGEGGGERYRRRRWWTLRRLGRWLRKR